MRLTHTSWQRLLRSVWPYAILIAVLASGLIGLDRLHASQATLTPASFPQQSGSVRGVRNVPVCGDQLAIAGYSITLSTQANAAQTAQSALGLGTGDLAPEFLPLTSGSLALSADSAAKSLALDRQQMVRTRMLHPASQSALVAKLRSTPGVVAAEPIWLQSSDKRYLSCDYKLQDNTADQALAGVARQSLISAGVSASALDDAGTMEFVSLRHFNGRLLLQVAFVRRPVGGPSAAYVSVLDPGTHAVLADEQANWYLWG